MSSLRRVQEHSFSLLDSTYGLSTDSQDRDDTPMSPCQGPAMDFDMTPIFLDSDEEIDTEELHPTVSRAAQGRSQVPSQSFSLVLLHSDLYTRRCARHTAS